MPIPKYPKSLIVVFGFWILVMLWLSVSGFTWDTATITTIGIAIFAYINRVDNKIAGIGYMASSGA